MPKMQSDDDIGVKALAYVNRKQKEKDIKKEIGELRVDLEGHLRVNGEETDRGHKIITVSHAGEEVELKHEMRSSSVVKPDALTLVRGILSKDQLKRVIENVEVLRTDVIEALHKDGDISDEQLTQLYELKTSFAFKVTHLKKKE